MIDFASTAEVRELEARTQSPDRLGVDVVRVAQHREALRCPARLREAREERDPEHVLDLVGVAHALVERVPREGHSDPERKPEDRGQGAVPLRPRGDLTGAHRLPDDRGARLEELDRPQVLLLLEQVAVDLGSRGALLAELGETALELPARGREAGRVHLVPVARERLSVRVRKPCHRLGLTPVTVKRSRSAFSWGETDELSRSSTGVTSSTPAIRIARSATSGVRASAACVRAKRSGSEYALTFGTPVNAEPRSWRLSSTSDDALKTFDCCIDRAIATIGRISVERTMTHLWRRTIAR